VIPPPPSAPRRLAAVIFDFDGIVLDSETPEFESHRLIFERCGVSLAADEWCAHIGTTGEGGADRWFTQLCQLSDRAPDRATFAAEKHRIFLELVPDQPMRGIVALLDALRETGVPPAIASNSTARWVIPAVDRLGLRDRFAAIVTVDDVVKGKPAPDVYVEAARRLGVSPLRAVGIEDSASGIASARAAGLRSVAIPHPLTAGHDLSAADLQVAHAGELNVDVLEGLITPRL
jgi:HAD superfamily hydrolase (TIGR01509 family)